MSNNPFSAKKQKLFLTLLEKGYFRKDAYTLAEVSRQTVTKYLKQDESFRLKLQKAESQGRLKAYSAIYRAIEEGDWQAARYWLSRRHFHMFNPESRNKFTGAEVAGLFSRFTAKIIELVPEKAHALASILEEVQSEIACKTS